MPKKKKSLQSTTQPHPLPSTISSPSQDPSPDQPSPQTPQQQSRPHRRRTRSAPRVIASIWYHTSFSFFIVLLAVVFVASAWGLAEQALRTGGVQRWWNIIIIVGAYVVLVSWGIGLALGAGLGLGVRVGKRSIGELGAGSYRESGLGGSANWVLGRGGSRGVVVSYSLED